MVSDWLKKLNAYFVDKKFSSSQQSTIYKMDVSKQTIKPLSQAILAKVTGKALLFIMIHWSI